MAASVAARFDLTYDRIEELRVAVDEAATLVLQAGPASALTLDLDVGDRRAFTVKVSSDGPVDAWPGNRVGSWAWRVIDELASGAVMTSTEGGCPEVTFSWLLEQPSGTHGGRGA